jgi:hypothetical protein
MTPPIFFQFSLIIFSSSSPIWVYFTKRARQVIERATAFLQGSLSASGE